ncbi:3-hydroxyanthranilate 3,4-dioxygenase 2 [Aspergillus viridinutans]|uniref:3-hydroxyanthranilate 3,4-dioxygenase 2 n=1 Tax=Aspergillus viridinutans TaxID=75553 RepID=A0A9P3BPZ3_ASPVI|nr:3-hydroxyanthranilate 3,4-dioxygenase 2 [Aspergillus viridinutans]GIJ97960.1 3-hydroxyanthranilate 3,4-dioxygenase 2 [Aspergillus viridinutans]
MTILNPLSWATWLAENEDKLRPPVNNCCLHQGNDFILMAVGGPNERNDYHENDTFRDIPIKEGDMFLLPGNTPHNPVRYKDTIGLVMERQRPAESLDRLRWYCTKGNHSSPTIIREEVFHCSDLGTQLKPIIERWQQDEESRRCGECGCIADPK